MEKSWLKWLGQDELQPPDPCRTWVEPSSHDWFYGLPAPAQGSNQSYFKNQSSTWEIIISLSCSHHVSADKEVTGVRGEESQLERLQRCHLCCISWRPDWQTRGRKNPKVRGHSNLSTGQHEPKYIHTLRTNNKQGRTTPAEQLCSTGGWKHPGGILRNRLAVKDDHRRPSIKLTSQQLAGRSCAAAWLCRRA